MPRCGQGWEGLSHEPRIKFGIGFDAILEALLLSPRVVPNPPNRPFGRSRRSESVIFDYRVGFRPTGPELKGNGDKAEGSEGSLSSPWRHCGPSTVMHTHTQLGGQFDSFPTAWQLTNEW